MNWQRARTSEKKHERKNAIFDAAYSLFKKQGYDSISFNAIAVEAGFTKSNMYRYFSSKEEIFLNIFAELFQQWASDISEQLLAFEPEPDAEHFASVWTQTTFAHQQFLDLTPLLFMSLESNSSYEQLVAFKRLAANQLGKLAFELSQVYAQLSVEKAFNFLTLSFAAMSNYWAAESKQNGALKKLYQQEEFAALAPDFKRDLKLAITTTINGLTV